jgi:hypothetical protein
MADYSSAFPNVGVLRYNGVEFGAISHVKVNTEFVQDEARRTILYHRITLDVDALVADDDTTDGQMLSIRRRLGEQGRAFVFTGNGFGDDLVVNAGGPLRDVCWGPTPEVLSWEPIGSLRCCEIKWRIVVCVPVCDSGIRVVGMMALNYSIGYEIDKGWTTRTIRGYYQIAQTRVGRSIPDTADAFREFIAPHVPLGYDRTWTWDLSEDKSRMDFTITDTQQRSYNAYPPYVVAIDASHRVNVKKSTMGTLTCSINLSVETVANTPLVTNYAIFYDLAMRRLNLAERDGNVTLITSISCDESLFSRQSRFQLDYVILKGVQSQHKLDLLLDTGLFTPLGYSYTDSRNSLTYAQSQRGYSQMRNSPASDAIIDLCATGTPSQNPTDGEIDPRPDSMPSAVPNPPREGLRNRRPPADRSYMVYFQRMRIVREKLKVFHEALQEPDDQPASGHIPDNSAWDDWQKATGQDATPQQSGRSRAIIRHEFGAIRAGHPIPVPTIVRFGNQDAEEISREVIHDPPLILHGVMVNTTRAVVEYRLLNNPGVIDPTELPKPSAAP